MAVLWRKEINLDGLVGSMSMAAASSTVPAGGVDGLSASLGVDALKGGDESLTLEEGGRSLCQCGGAFDGLPAARPAPWPAEQVTLPAGPR